jgi:hypothetical protein
MTDIDPEFEYLMKIDEEERRRQMIPQYNDFCIIFQKNSYYLNRVFGENFRDKCYVRDVLCRNIVITEKEEYIIIHSKNIKPDGILEKVLSSLNIEP